MINFLKAPVVLAALPLSFGTALVAHMINLQHAAVNSKPVAAVNSLVGSAMDNLEITIDGGTQFDIKNVMHTRADLANFTPIDLTTTTKETKTNDTPARTTIMGVRVQLHGTPESKLSLKHMLDTNSSDATIAKTSAVQLAELFEIHGLRAKAKHVSAIFFGNPNQGQNGAPHSAAVPEPSTIVAVGLGVMGLVQRGRRKSSTRNRIGR